MYRLPAALRNPGRIVQIYGTLPQGQFGNIAPANVRDIVGQATVFAAISPYSGTSSNLAEPGEPANRAPTLTVAGNFFQAWGVSPILGRPFNPGDDRPGHNDVVIVSEQFWRNKMGHDPHVLGRVLRLNGTPVTVVGVAPADCQDYFTWGPIEMWQPLGYTETTWHIRDNPWMGVLARLKPEVSVAQAQAQLATIAARLAHDHPDTNSQAGLNVVLYQVARSQGAAQVLWLMMIMMLFVLLIACVNLANLQLARTTGRLREHAIRIALGASRAQRIRQLLFESVLLSLIGGGLGLVVAIWGNRILSSSIQLGPETSDFTLPLDYRVLAFSFIASVATGIAFGIMPAWIASGADVNLALKQSGRGTSGDRSKHRTRQILVVAEVALALTLISAAACYVGGIERLTRKNPGWEAKNRLNGSFVLSYGAYTNNDQVRAVVDRLETRLAQLPGIDQVAIAGSNPIYGLSHQGNFVIEGRPAPLKGSEPLAQAERISPSYFSTLGIHLMAGRPFALTDKADSRQVVIINAAMAREFWPKGDAIGHRIGGTDPAKPNWQEIVGIVNDLQFPANIGTQQSRFQMYRPFAQDPEHWLTFTLYGSGASASLAGAVRQAVAQIDPDLAVYNLDTVEGTLRTAGQNNVLIGGILAVAAGLGLVLALIGVYGVVANLAIQRTQEIGIRMALGASPKSVLWLVLNNGIRLAVIGTGIGLIGAYVVTHGIDRALPGIPGQDPLLVCGLAALLVGATLLACWVPARRATRVNPVEALRAE
jgi:predicted permease